MIQHSPHRGGGFVRLLCFVLFLCGVVSAGNPPRYKPALHSRQLLFADVLYGASGPWFDTTLARWYAQRKTVAIGSNGTASAPYITYMKNYNDSLHVLAYDQWSIILSGAGATGIDTTTDVNLGAKHWAANVASPAVNFEDMVLRATGTVTITRADGAQTMSTGQLLRSVGFAGQIRLVANSASLSWGAYRYWRYRNSRSAGIDGIMLDEYTGLQRVVPPFGSPAISEGQAGTSYDAWFGSSAWTAGWGNFTNRPSSYTGTYTTDIRNALVEQWQGIVRQNGKTSWLTSYADSIWANGGYFATNCAEWGGPGFNNSVIFDSVMASLHGGLTGEFWAIAPSRFYADNSGIDSRKFAAVDHFKRFADNPNCNIFHGWLHVGQHSIDAARGWDTTNNYLNGLKRDHQNALAFMLVCTYPGPAQQYWGFGNYAGFALNRELSKYRTFSEEWAPPTETAFPYATQYVGQGNWSAGGYISTNPRVIFKDTTRFWDYTWGLRWGWPVNDARVIQSGTDPLGTNYSLYAAKMYKDSAATVLQTYALLRMAQSVNQQLPGSQINVTLPTSPTGVWYEVYHSNWLPEGSANFFSDTTIASGATVGIGNAHARIFVADTTYSLSDPDPVTDTTIAISGASGLETNSGTWTMRLIVTVGNAPSGVSGNKTFLVNSANGSATSGSDYDPLVNQTETIESGHTADTIFVTINGDVTVESSETFTLTISSPSSGIVLGSPTVATGTIQNDDFSSPSANDLKVVISGRTVTSGRVVIDP